MCLCVSLALSVFVCVYVCVLCVCVLFCSVFMFVCGLCIMSGEMVGVGERNFTNQSVQIMASGTQI